MSVMRFEKDGGLGRIVLADAPFNWVGEAYRRELREAVRQAGEADIRALLIHAEGPNFSAGGAVHEWPSYSRPWLLTFLAEVNQAYRAIEALRFPVVAAVRGAATGGGLELALACDVIIASENTVLWSPEIIGGTVPLAGAVPRLASRLGWPRARRITMLGERTPVTDVPDVADYVVADDDLDQFALDLATRLSQGPTVAYAAHKALFRAYSSGGVPVADELLADLTTHLFMTQDAGMGMAGFVPVYLQLGAPGAQMPPGGVQLPQPAFTGA